VSSWVLVNLAMHLHVFAAVVFRSYSILSPNALPLFDLSIANPSPPPKINVITDIGNSENGSFHAIRIAVGSKIKNETITPLMIAGILKSIEEIIKPTITHIENAEIFASHDNFCIIIGTTSRIPAIVPKAIPINLFLLIFRNPPCFCAKKGAIRFPLFL